MSGTYLKLYLRHFKRRRFFFNHVKPLVTTWATVTVSNSAFSPEHGVFYVFPMLLKIFAKFFITTLTG